MFAGKTKQHRIIAEVIHFFPDHIGKIYAGTGSVQTKEFAGYLGVRYCVGLNSGTDALILAIRALQIGAGDEGIVTAGHSICACFRNFQAS